MSRPVDPIYVAVGQAIRRRREQLGISQFELAETVGLTRSSITNLEAGRQQTPLHVLYGLADALSTPLAALLPEEREVVSARTAELGKEDLDRFRQSLMVGGRTRRV